MTEYKKYWNQNDSRVKKNLKCGKKCEKIITLDKVKVETKQNRGGPK